MLILTVVVIAGIQRVTFGFISVSRGDNSSQTKNVSSHLLPRARSTIAAAAAAIRRCHIVWIRVRSAGATANFHGRLLFSITCPSSPPGGRQTERAARSAHLHVSCADKTNFEPPDEIRRTGREFVIRQRGALSLGTYRCVSNLFRYASYYDSVTLTNHQTVCRAKRFLLCWAR